MLLRESGFTFNGLHSRSDMGLLYAEKDGHVMIPRIKRNAYQIAGISGTVLLPGETWEPIALDGTLYPAEERATQAEAQQLLRRVAAWLTAGRCRLIFDYEPDKFYLAELSDQSKWSLKNWFGGELPIRFEAQPFAYSVSESSASAQCTGDSATLALSVSTGQRAPLRLQIENTGSAPLTGVTARLSGGADAVILAGMNLTSGQTLIIDLEPPISAQIASANALPYAQAFAPILLSDGANSIEVLFTWGSGSKEALVTAYARGRW